MDIAVRGEGEQIFLKLAQCPFDSKSLQGVDGITFRNKRQIVRTPSRPFIQNLDELPYPAYDCFPLEKPRLFGGCLFPPETAFLRRRQIPMVILFFFPPVP